MEVLSLLSDDVETDDATPGENLKLRLKGIEEEEILPGFILCNAENLCHSGRTFDAQVGAPSKWNRILSTSTEIRGHFVHRGHRKCRVTVANEAFVMPLQYTLALFCFIASP